MKKTVALLLFAMSTVTAFAQNWEYENNRHSISIVIGGPISQDVEEVIDESEPLLEPCTTTDNIKESPHIGIEYGYRLRPWLELAMLANIQYCTWEATYHNNGTKQTTDEYDYDLYLIPQARFVYLRKGWIEMHSGAGLGLALYGTSEKSDYRDSNKTGVALDLNYVGVSLGGKHLRVNFDLGGTWASYSDTKLDMNYGRRMRVGLSYRF